MIIKDLMYPTTEITKSIIPLIKDGAIVLMIKMTQGLILKGRIEVNQESNPAVKAL